MPSLLPPTACAKVLIARRVSRLGSWLLGAHATRNLAGRDAEGLPALVPARLTVIGAGASLRPILGGNPGLVLPPNPCASPAAGLNHEGEDRGRVPPPNLLGIIQAALAKDAVE